MRYSVAGVGSVPQVIDGKLYTIDLIDQTGNNQRITAYGVPSLLSDPVGHGSLGLVDQFPNIHPGVFEAVMPKPLELLIGNEFLSLYPKCMNGRGCEACGANLCTYESKFGYGHVLVGHLSSLSSSPRVASNVTQMVNSICVARVKVQPVMDGEFLVGESLGTSPVPRCADCNKCLEKCRVCSSETAVCLVQELKQYTVWKENCQVDVKTQTLSCKYTFTKDPSVLENNGSQALACQRSQ